MRLLWSRNARDDLFAIADHYRDIDPDWLTRCSTGWQTRPGRCWTIHG